MFTRGEIFPKSDTCQEKSDTCQDDKYIATGFVLFDLDCVRRLKNSADQGWIHGVGDGVGVTLEC